MNLFAELRRRHVYRIAIAYVIASWVVLQFASLVFPMFGAPDWVLKVFLAVLVLGFPIALILAWAFELTPEGVRRTEPVHSPEARPVEAHRRVGRTLDFVIIAVLALAVAVLAWHRWGPQASAPPETAAAASAAPSAPARAGATATMPATSAPAAAVPEKSIAVLPFENLSSDKANAYFADGMQDEILTGLAKIGDMKVISRTSTQRYASKPDNIPEIARQLGVANILEGSVQKANDRVRINVQLINALTDSHRWAETYDRTLNDVFAVQSEVAEKIAASLKAQLTGQERASLTERPTGSTQAYQAYLRARALMGRGYDLSTSRQAVENLREAVKLDPEFVLAWANIAQVGSYLYLNGVDPSVYTGDFVKHAADTASRLQPDSVEAQLAQGYYRYRVLRDFAGADREFKQVLQREPNNAGALQSAGFAERRQGKWTEALQHLLQAAERDPRNPGLMTAIGGETLNNMRRWDDARMWLDRALEIEPDSSLAISYKAGVYQQEGRLQDAARVLDPIAQAGEDPQVAWFRSQQRLLERRYADAVTELQAMFAQPESALNGWGPQLEANLGEALALAGDKSGARATWQRLIEQTRPHATVVNDSMMPMMLAVAYAGVGDDKLALEQARRAVDLYRDDAIYLPIAKLTLAQVQTMAGDHAAAIAGLAPLLKVPAGMTVAQLRLDPIWDPLRGDPGFKALLDQGDKVAAATGSPDTPNPAH